MNAKELRGALRSALNSGMQPEEIADLVGIVIDDHGDEPTADTDTCTGIYEVYDMPDGAITLGAIRRKYGVPRTTVRLWMEKGRVSTMGRLRGSGPAPPVLVNELQVAECVRTWRKQKKRKK